MDILAANGVAVKAFVDDNPRVTTYKGIPVVKSSKGLSPFIVSIGSNVVRKRIAESLSADFCRVFHPSAVISPSAVIGEGTVVMQGAVIQAEARVGKHCIVNTAATIDHECCLGDYVHLSPRVTLCGNVQVDEGIRIGAGATVIQGVKIGRWCVIGAGSVVTKDIPDGVVAVGTICKPIKPINSEMLKNIDGGVKELFEIKNQWIDFTLRRA